MSRKRKELPLIENVTIRDVAAEGKAVARLDDGLVVFIPYGAPGDVADIQLTKKKKSFGEGTIARMIKPNAEVRTEPRCAHFGVCGGCKWQHLAYAEQLRCKQQQVVDALERIGGLHDLPLEPILGSENIYEYRNKLEYTFSNRRWLTREQMESDEVFDSRDGAGFHIAGAFDKVLDIDRCHLQEDFSNSVRNFVKDYAREKGYTFYDLRQNCGLLRTMMVRTASTGERMLLMVFGEENPEAIADVMGAVNREFPEITSLLYTVNLKANDTFTDLPIHTFAGKDHIEEEMEGRLRFTIGPKSFYQTNSRQAERLYGVVRDMAALTGNELVYDLYTGTGTIALFLAEKARRVVGIEYVEAAIEDARANAKRNGLEDKTLFYAGDMKDVLDDDFISRHGVPDVMIVDPPRAGMHPDVVATILRAAPRRLVYVSCNAATQARDLAMLSERYCIDRVRPVDMFPHTAHVENVVALSLK